ncbi:hypothetical protein V6N13_124119 [Hibiscus sabdariffa]
MGLSGGQARLRLLVTAWVSLGLMMDGGSYIVGNEVIWATKARWDGGLKSVRWRAGLGMVKENGDRFGDG